MAGKRFSPMKKLKEVFRRVMDKHSSESSAGSSRDLHVASRYAVLVGCNYPNTKNELHGCVNDVTRMTKTLLERFGFSEENIETLIDTDENYTLPTGQNIMASLQAMIRKASSGDVLFFHYSGHGTRVRHTGDETGYDECIVPCDLNLIKDDDFRTLVNQLPQGTSFTIISDSCHSGGLIDKETEQIGPNRPTRQAKAEAPAVKPRFIPPEDILEALKEQIPDEGEVTEVNAAVFKVFGTHATQSIRKSASFSLHSKEILEEESGKGDEAAAKQKAKVDPDMGILMSGCQSDETSADACPSGNNSEAFGAFSDALQKVLGDHPKPISNKELVLQARKILARDGYEQHPCLYCSDANAKAIFLSQR